MKLGIDLCSFQSVHGGGKDEVAYNLLRGFSKLGYAKNIVCYCHPELVDKIHEVDQEFQVFTVPSRKFKKLMLRYLASYLDGLAVKKYIVSDSVDAILFTNKTSPLMRFPIKTFVITHDVQLFRKLGINGQLKQKIYNSIDQRLIKLEFALRDEIISISDFDKAEISHFIPKIANKVKRIYNPIRFSEQINAENKKRYITALNIQWPHKNIKTLIKAYSIIAEQIQEDLILVGKKPDDYAELEQYIQELGIVNRVHFTGFVSDEQLQQIISQTRIYVNPSFYEGFGMTAVEMMGWGIPTIVAANTAQFEVTQGLCSYYKPTEDAVELSKIIINEIRSPIPEKALMETAERIKASYDYIVIAKQYWEYIEAKVSGNQ